MYNFRTDLALERRDLYKRANNIENEVDGIETEEEKVDEDIRITRVKVLNENGEKAIGKKSWKLYNNRHKQLENSGTRADSKGF